MRDEDQIRYMLALFPQRYDDYDVEGCCELFVEEAEWHGSRDGERFKGLPAIRAFLERRAVRTPNRQSKHLFGNALIEIDDKTATARAISDVVIFQRFESGPWEIRSAARFTDRLKRTDQGWRFQERHIHQDNPTPRSREG